MTTYGKKGGQGPTAGQRAQKYSFVLPDGTSAEKRAFGAYEQPTAYAYQHDGVWYAAGISDANDPKFSSAFTQCKAYRRTK